MRPGRPPFEAGYPITTKNGQGTVPIKGAYTNECPRSYMTQESIQAVDDILADEWIHSRTDATLHGSDSAAWPARHYDAVLATTLEQSRIDKEIDRCRQMIN